MIISNEENPDTLINIDNIDTIIRSDTGDVFLIVFFNGKSYSSWKFKSKANRDTIFEKIEIIEIIEAVRSINA
jgi:hypothetical protein